MLCSLYTSSSCLLAFSVWKKKKPPTQSSFVYKLLCKPLGSVYIQVYSKYIGDKREKGSEKQQLMDLPPLPILIALGRLSWVSTFSPFLFPRPFSVLYFFRFDAALLCALPLYFAMGHIKRLWRRQR